MWNKRSQNLQGFTIVELTIGKTLFLIIFLVAGVVVVDSSRGWFEAYNRIYSGVVSQSEIARRTFDRIVRKASSENTLSDEFGLWAEVCYYQNSASVELDRYARFYTIDNELKIEHGSLNPKSEINTQTICSNVSSCFFINTGTSLQLFLELENDTDKAVILSSAVMHN